MKFELSAFLNSGTLLSLDFDRLIIGWGKRIWSAKPSGTGPHFYYPDFFLKEGSPWFTQECWSIVNRSDFIQLLPESFPEPLKWTCLDQLTFETAFNDLQKCFKQGQLNKAVPYIFERADAKLSPSLFKHLLKNVLNYSTRYPVHVYGMWTEGEGILGATPEVLFDYDTTVKTVACAGTYPAGRYTPDEKTLHEHQLVIKGICESLDPFGEVVLGELALREFASLGHLMTPIELIPQKPLDFLSLVEALHPTPALGAFPRDAGMQWLEKYQMHVARGRFGAPVGCLHDGKGRCVVGIRNVQWNTTGMSIGAGCGLVPASKLHDEWNELQLKLSAIKGILGI